MVKEQVIGNMNKIKYKSGVYRIYDRFFISRRGPMYILDYELHSDINLGDILYDSKGNRFRAIGKEKSTSCFVEPTGNDPEGVLFEMLDEKRAQGGVMIKDMDIVEIPKNAAIMGGDPLPYMTVEQMWKEVEKIQSIQELVDVYATVHNKFWYIEDHIYDYEEGTDEYKRICYEIGEWADIRNHLHQRVMEEVDKEGFLYDYQPEKGCIKQLSRLMDKYGYYDGNGWWIAKNEAFGVQMKS